MSSIQLSRTLAGCHLGYNSTAPHKPLVYCEKNVRIHVYIQWHFFSRTHFEHSCLPQSILKCPEFIQQVTEKSNNLLCTVYRHIAAEYYECTFVMLQYIHTRISFNFIVLGWRQTSQTKSHKTQTNDTNTICIMIPWR